MTAPDALRTKPCSACKEDLPLSEFYPRRSERIKNPESRTQLTSHCKRCTYLAVRERHRKSFEIIAAIKMERGCSDCGYRAHHAALHFDHLPQFEKSFSISQAITSKPLVKIFKEIEKCEVVCGNCHAVRTYERRRAKGVTWDDVRS